MFRKPKSESYIVPVVMNKSNENNKPEQSPVLYDHSNETVSKSFPMDVICYIHTYIATDFILGSNYC